MPASAFDSRIYRDLFHDVEVGRLFTDTAEIRAMLLVFGALAGAQGATGMIPETAAAFIQRAAAEVQIDPAGLAPETGQSAVVVPALVAAFRRAMQAPEHAAWVHWGATSQDIMDTGLALRLRQVVSILDGRLAGLLAALGAQATAHRALPLAARTYGQAATPTSFGAVVAGWGWPLLRHRQRLAELRPRLLCVSLSGASSNLSAMGPEAPRVVEGLARALDLRVPDGPWHSARDSVAEFSGWLALFAGSLAKLGDDLVLMTQGGIAEVRLAQGGGSSTMPQKQNPVLPSLLVALGRFAAAQHGAILAAMVHRQQRDGAAWMLEWLTLPQICMATARALAVAEDLARTLAPDAHRMRAGLEANHGLIFAEALSFCMAKEMPRPEAQAAVKALCRRAQAEGRGLMDLALEAWPSADLSAAFDPAMQLGQAPADADRFAAAVRG